jgi:anti-sigma factor RsiW
MTYPLNPGNECVRAWEAMPHALQGNLAPQQSAWLDDHLACCDACREEFAQQQRLQRAMSLPVDMPFNVEADLQRLLSRIDNPDIPMLGDSPRHAGWAGRALVAAVLVQAIGLGVMGAKLWSMDPAPAYRTLGQEAAPMPSGAIRVVPDPSMTLADWDASLHAHGLHVVAGPNDAGAYTVVPSSADANREALVQRLRATNGMLLAEPVAGTP